MFRRVCQISFILLCLSLLCTDCTKKVTEIYESPDLLDFVYIKGGIFNNGVGDVQVSSFFISRREVEQNEFWAIMGYNPSEFQNVVNGPANNICWFDAIVYCNLLSERDGLQPCYSYATLGTDITNWPEKWYLNQGNHLLINCNWDANGYRLPTEMEWVYAAKGGEKTQNYTYCGSHYASPVAWFSGNSSNSVHTICTRAPNELGLYDMSGNVTEFCWDIFAALTDSFQIDPHGPDYGETRVIKSGAYPSPSSDIIPERRFHGFATSVENTLGLRLCRNAD